jgi:hypothetical protein
LKMPEFPMMAKWKNRARITECKSVTVFRKNRRMIRSSPGGNLIAMTSLHEFNEIRIFSTILTTNFDDLEWGL